MHTSNSSTLDEPVFHRDLHALCIRLRKIHSESSIADFEPLAPPPPIIDASVEIDGDEDSQWSQQENIPGIRLLKESVKSDLERLEAVSLLRISNYEVNGDTWWYDLIRTWCPVVFSKSRQ